MLSFAECETSLIVDIDSYDQPRSTEPYKQPHGIHVPVLGCSDYTDPTTGFYLYNQSTGIYCNKGPFVFHPINMPGFNCFNQQTIGAYNEARSQSEEVPIASIRKKVYQILRCILRDIDGAKLRSYMLKVLP